MEESSEKVELAQIYAIEVSELKRLLAEAKADVKAEVKADVKAKAAPLHLSKERLIELSKESRPGSLVELQLARYKFVNGLSKEGLWSSLSEASTQELRNFLAVFNFKISKELSTNSQYQKSQGSLCRYFVGPECMTKVCLLSESQLAEDARVVFREVEVTSQISGATSLVLVSKYCFPARQELIVVDSRPFMFVVTSYPHILYNLNQYMVNNAQIVNQEILIEAFDKILHDLALSVFYLQASGFIHGWINVNTIFYRADTGSWVLGDFSQAQQIHKNSYINDDQLHARMKGDVYQLGEVLVQFLLNDMSQQISKKSALDQDIYLAMIKNLTSNEAFQKPLIILQNDIYRQTAVLQHMIAPAPEKRYDILEVCLSLILNKQFLQPFAVINELQQQKFQQPEEGRVHISTKTLSSISELFEFQRPAQTQLQPGAQVQPGKSPKSQERTITQIRMGEKLIYEGEINARGMPQGEGVFYIGQDNIWVYSGRFSEGYFDGEGTITLNRKVICFGVFEFGLNKQYLEKLEVGAFTQLCKEYSEFLIKYSAERKWLELACERNAELKARNELVFGMNYSSDKQDIVRVLNTLVKFMDADITTILFNFKNSQTSSVKEFQQIEITTVEGQLVRFRFNFGYVIKEEEFFILLDKSRRLVHLKLNMGFTHVSDKFFYGMSSNDKLSQLVELNLQKVYMITDDGLISFLQSSISHNLRVLDISFTQITDRSVLVLASPEACWASQLVQLRMRNCLDITEKSLVEYVTSPNAQCIQLLDFSGLDLTDSLIYEISYSSYMGKLASLYVNECPKITFESLGHLGKSPFMLFLSTLELSKCLKQQLSAEQAPGFIKSLLLQNQMKKKFQNMTSSQQLQNLKCLNFYSTGIQDVHIKQLANSPFFKSLKELNISRCEQLTDSSIYHIAHSNNFTNLHVLDMQDLKLITGESLKQLGKSKYLKKIEVLKLAGCSQLQPAVLSQSFNQVSNFLLLKQLLIDEMQFDADLLRIINFSMSTNQPQFSRFQEFQIAVDNANIFLQLHLENIIGLNSRVFRFMVNQYKEHDVVLNLAGILPLMSLQISQCQGAIYVNSVLINQQLVEDVVTQQYNRASLSQQMMEKQTAAPAPCFWTGEVLLSLNRTRIFDSLVTLNLAGMTEKMHPAVFTSIAQSRYFPNLHALVLDNTSVDDAAMQGLFQHQPTHLRLFSVRQCNLLSFEGLKCLLHKGGYDHLEQLDIRDSQAAGTEFSLNLHRFKSLRHLNDGFIQVSVKCMEGFDQETIKLTVEDILKKVGQLEQVCYLSISFEKVKCYHSFLSGLSYIFLSQIKHLRELRLTFSSCQGICMDQNTIFWNNILQLKQLKKLALNFQKIKQIQLNYLKNLFYAISVLIQLESLTLTFPHCAFEESTVSYKTLILPLIRLVKIKELLLSFSCCNSLDSEFAKGMNEMLPKLTTLARISLNYGYCYNVQQEVFNNFILELSKSEMQLQEISLDFEMCQIDKKFWKHLEALFQAKKTFQIINLNLNNCPQQNPKYFFKIVEALLNQNGLDLLNINFQQTFKLTEKNKKELCGYPKIYQLKSFELVL